MIGYIFLAFDMLYNSSQMEQNGQQRQLSKEYGEEKVYQMVLKRYKDLRSQGILQSLEDIYVKQPISRILKDEYVFSFDNVKNHVEERINDKSKLQKILIQETKAIRGMEIKNLREVDLEKQEELYSEKLRSGLPIFKSILYMRYQDNQNWTQFFGEEKAFAADQLNIDFPQIKADIGKIKYFLQQESLMAKMNLQFSDENRLEVQYDRFPTLNQIEKRADVMAKLLLYNIFSEQHRKLKQVWKNDERYQHMKKNQKKLKAEIQPEKLKQGQKEEQDDLLRIQVRKVYLALEQRANIIANQQFKQLNGDKAVQTKKSLQKLKALLGSERNPRIQLKYLIAYKQKKNW